MSSTSKKHRDFISEPMGDKPVTELAGVGQVYGGRLTEKNYDKAFVVLGQFLLFKKDELLFKDWLKDICGMSTKHADDCHDCLRDWCLAFL